MKFIYSRFLLNESEDCKNAWILLENGTSLIQQLESFIQVFFQEQFFTRQSSGSCKAIIRMLISDSHESLKFFIYFAKPFQICFQQKPKTFPSLKLHDRNNTGKLVYICIASHQLFPHFLSLKLHDQNYTGKLVYICIMLHQLFPHFFKLKAP